MYLTIKSVFWVCYDHSIGRNVNLSPTFVYRWHRLLEILWTGFSLCSSTGERQNGAAPGNGSAAVTTLLPPDFNGATAGKHARIGGSTWHTASFYPSWEVNMDRQSDNSLPVVYKIAYRTISRMSQMCVCRQVFVIWAPAVDDASGRCSLLCSVLNCKINTTPLPARGTPVWRAYRRLCIEVFVIYVCHHTYVWHVFKMILLWFDGNGYLCRDTKIGNG